MSQRLYVDEVDCCFADEQVLPDETVPTYGSFRFGLPTQATDEELAWFQMQRQFFEANGRLMTDEEEEKLRLLL